MKTMRFRSSLLRRLVACGFLGLLVFPFGVASSQVDVEKMSPPGDCTEKEYEELKKKKKLVCEIDGKSEPPRCLETDTCEVLEIKEKAFLACQRARVDLMDKCFRGGNRGHKIEAGNTGGGAKNCEKIRTTRDECKKPFGTCPAK